MSLRPFLYQILQEKDFKNVLFCTKQKTSFSSISQKYLSSHNNYYIERLG